MEKFDYYEQSGKPWSDDEDKQLLKEYQEENMDIIQIGYIHKRTPGGIAYRLKVLNLITIQIDARGYQTYQASDLYREIVSKKEESTANKRLQKELVVANTLSESSSSNLNEYTNIGNPWTSQETIQLRKEYSEDQLSLLEISKIHKRLPMGIMSRLRQMNLVENQRTVRGYTEYKLSNIYKDVQKEKKDKVLEDKKRETNIVNVIDKPVELEVRELKEELRAMKASLSEMHEMLKAIYKFETQVVIKNVSKKSTLVNTCLI